MSTCWPTCRSRGSCPSLSARPSTARPGRRGGRGRHHRVGQQRPGRDRTGRVEPGHLGGLVPGHVGQPGVGRDLDLLHRRHRDPLARADLLGDLDRGDPLAALDHQEAGAERAAEDEQDGQRGQRGLALTGCAGQPPSARRGRLLPGGLVAPWRPPLQCAPVTGHVATISPAGRLPGRAHATCDDSEAFSTIGPHASADGLYSPESGATSKCDRIATPASTRWIRGQCERRRRHAFAGQAPHRTRNGGAPDRAVRDRAGPEWRTRASAAPAE